MYVAFHIEAIYPFNPAIFFAFQSSGLGSVETLPPRDYSNSPTQARGKHTPGKVGKEQIKTRKIPQPPVETGTGARGVHLNRHNHASQWDCRVKNMDWIYFETEFP